MKERVSLEANQHGKFSSSFTLSTLTLSPFCQPAIFQRSVSKNNPAVSQEIQTTFSFLFSSIFSVFLPSGDLSPTFSPAPGIVGGSVVPE
jgi:hypothetical protein